MVNQNQRRDYETERSKYHVVSIGIQSVFSSFFFFFCITIGDILGRNWVEKRNIKTCDTQHSTTHLAESRFSISANGDDNGDAMDMHCSPQAAIRAATQDLGVGRQTQQ